MKRVKGREGKIEESVDSKIRFKAKFIKSEDIIMKRRGGCEPFH